MAASKRHSSQRSPIIDKRANPMESRFTSSAMKRWSRTITQTLLAFAPPTTKTVRDALERFRAEEMHGLAVNTLRWMDPQLHAIEREIGRKPIDSDFRGIALRWYDTLAPTTANNRTMLLARLCVCACRWDWRTREHDLRGLCEKKSGRRTRILNPRQRVELPEYTDRTDVSARRHVALQCIKFLFFSGWRPSEACGLRRDWLERDADGGAAVAHLPRTKTGPQARTISPQALAVLDAQPNVGPWFFPYFKPGRGLTPKSVAKEFATMRADLGWPSVLCAMSMRHTVSTVGAQQRLPVAFVAALVGNSAAVQLRVYQHPQPEDLADAASSIGTALVAGGKVK